MKFLRMVLHKYCISSGTSFLFRSPHCNQFDIILNKLTGVLFEIATELRDRIVRIKTTVKLEASNKAIYFLPLINKTTRMLLLFCPSCYFSIMQRNKNPVKLFSKKESVRIVNTLFL